MFKVGDRVKVIKKVEHETGWNDTWIDKMNELIGKESVIELIDDEFGLLFENFPYTFPPSSLELIEGDE